MSAGIPRSRQILVLALAVGALSLLVVAVSAYLRLDAAGLGCADWPHCYGRVLAGDPAPLSYGYARLLHRIAASSALVLTLVLVWRCLRPQPLQPAARYALWLLALMLALAGLGFFSADPRRALVGFLNIVGGLGLVSFSWRVAVAANRPEGGAPTTASSGLLRIGVAGLSLAVVLGAWIGATYSAVACPTLPFCASAGWTLADVGRSFNLLVLLEAAPMPGEPGAASLHFLHRGFALLALISFALVALRTGRRAARVVLALLVLTMLLGAVAVASGMALWPVVGHGVAAAVLLAAVASLLRR